MTDPNRLQWEEHRTFTARVKGTSLNVLVWGSTGRFWWEVDRFDRLTNQSASRGGTATSLLEAKRAGQTTFADLLVAK